MNLEDVIDSEYGLQQDEWSLSKPRFGEEVQLEVVGWSGKNTTNKYYILKCDLCSGDHELFGEGYFRSVKSSLVKGQVPCGCSRSPSWTKEQYHMLCSRKAKELGCTFLTFAGEWKGGGTKIKMLCEKHGVWDSGAVASLINLGSCCPKCRDEACRKPDSDMIASFLSSGAFHPATRFWRSERKTKQGCKDYWGVDCPECGGTGESRSCNLKLGQLPCKCSKHRQQECYINRIIDEYDNTVALKFGIANSSKHRIKQQNYSSAYTLKQHSIYRFPSVKACKKAERECKQELECGVVLKRDMPDGYTETTWVYNLEKIIEIYKRNGGVRVE